MDQLVTALVSILTAVVGVAMLSVIVSKNSQTPEVLTAGGNAFGNILGIAVGPVTGYTPGGSAFSSISIR